jgi:hypothetical protein
MYANKKGRLSVLKYSDNRRDDECGVSSTGPDFVEEPRLVDSHECLHGRRER